jgi:replicative DNA helicase
MHAASANTPMDVLLGGIQGVGPGIDALRETYRLLADLPLRLTDLRDVRRIVDLIEKHAAEGGELVVLDQLSKITAPYLLPSANAYQKTSEISEQLRLVAIQTGLPLVIIVQVNREASKRSGELELYDLRDSGMLEQDAATVILINSATDPPIATGQPRTFAKLLPVKLAKNRFGPAGSAVELLWHPRIARIDDLAMKDRH